MNVSRPNTYINAFKVYKLIRFLLFFMKITWGTFQFMRRSSLNIIISSETVDFISIIEIVNGVT